MSFQIKECLFCHRRLPHSHFRKHNNAADGLFGWCKQCEKMYSFQEKEGEWKHVVSFSGGKDSTALLFMMMERKMRIDALVYFNCGSFEFPQMENHIEKIKTVLETEKIRFIELKPKMDFFDMAHSYRPPGKRKYNGWPTPELRWCTMIKINTIKSFMRSYRPYIQYIGFAVDENDRVLKAAVAVENSGRKYFKNRFPLAEWGLTEKQCLEYCFQKGFTWDGLYNHFDRVSCWCCPLQGKGDLSILHKHFPELWDRLKKMNRKIVESSGRHFKDDPTIFNKIEFS